MKQYPNPRFSSLEEEDEYWKTHSPLDEGYEEVKMECSCRVVHIEYGETEIEYCLLHKSAPDLYEALGKASVIIHNAIRYTEGEYRVMLQRELKQIEQALAKAGA